MPRSDAQLEPASDARSRGARRGGRFGYSAGVDEQRDRMTRLVIGGARAGDLLMTRRVSSGRSRRCPDGSPAPHSRPSVADRCHRDPGSARIEKAWMSRSWSGMPRSASVFFRARSRSVSAAEAIAAARSSPRSWGPAYLQAAPYSGARGMRAAPGPPLSAAQAAPRSRETSAPGRFVGESGTTMICDGRTKQQNGSSGKSKSQITNHKLLPLPP